MSYGLKRKLGWGLGLGLLVFGGLVLYGDVREIGRLLQDFRWGLLPAILGLTVINYLLRAVRFHYYLRQVGVSSISLWLSVRLFVGGFALTLTPGKLGELVRVVWLKKLVGAEPARTTPTILVDRVVDGVAMAILAMAGLLGYPQYRAVVLPVLAVLLLAIGAVQIRPLAQALLSLAEKLPLLARIAPQLGQLYESAYTLLGVKNLLLGLSVGLLAWLAEGYALYLTLRGLGVPPSGETALLAVFTLATGSLLGGASSLPGGLGAAEVSMTGILQTVVGLSENVAATATLFIRFFTLWFGVLLGVLVVFLWRHLLLMPETELASMESDSEAGEDEMLEVKSEK